MDSVESTHVDNPTTKAGMCLCMSPLASCMQKNAWILTYLQTINLFPL